MITRTSWLNVNGVDLATPAWEVMDLTPLLDDGRVRGSDVLMPGAVGVRPIRRRRTVRTVTLPLLVMGTHDSDGVAIDDPLQGVADHMLYLPDALGVGLSTGDGTVPAVWTLPDQSELAADVHVLGLVGSTLVGYGEILTTLDLSIPSGRFVEVGS